MVLITSADDSNVQTNFHNTEGILKAELKRDKGVIRVKKQEMLKSMDKQGSVANQYNSTSAG
ncbi:hypothetical protein Ga0466249_003205 [Sporomusaceae bacterium BoRhaA]|uniref:hypothetical protein n=1 Tax=Pelorhabdus rhamnosifermentans TaxID=2772457 RepID=UPI001C062CFB|nr:hypothetical protein [Pelorhabdus rhamnosifermentans]MBU2702078.1 hypothetical protein [Pelorhabdus rhamnosifermentans]